MAKFTSKELALCYMTANGTGLTPEDFLVKLYEIEEKYEELLTWDDPAEKIKTDRLASWKRLVE
ncbi:hypothetical protein J5Z53_004134 [Citrobacter braakii]|uniref:hypothetical protein n=1 Tax=Citrobacter braakii TaxID=57706 RepID=UPI00333A735E|nr:hypothetical protein [Citrobacter braakii]